MNQLIDAIDRVIGWIAAGVLSVAFCLLIFSVFSRYVAVNLQLDWILEVVVFMIVWAVLLGVARIEKRASHIRVDFVLDYLTPIWRRRAEFLALIIGLSISLFYVWSGIYVVQEAVMWGERTDSTLRIPFWVLYSALSVSFSIHSLFLIQRIFLLLNGHEILKQQDLAN